jgi:uncharacterized protein YndB with AHSA1/START domain
MTDERQFTITRVFDAPREAVFRAWVDPDQIARWFGPKGVHTPRDRISIDPRPGGAWRLVMVGDDDGGEYPAAFVYREVVEPERLVLISSLLADPHTPDERSLITVTFADLGGATEMTFHARGYTAAEEEAGLEAGWGSIFHKLADHLATIAAYDEPAGSAGGRE